LLKRTAKIETQAGAAQNKWLLRGKSVAAAKGKDLANAEAENAAAAMPTLPVPYGTNPNTPINQLRLKSILAL
jgi:hypothetical protein